MTTTLPGSANALPQQLLARAVRGDVQAMSEVGIHFDRALDTANAFVWFERAALGGHCWSMAEVALKLIVGVDDKPDYTKASEWLRGALERVGVNAVVGARRHSVLHLAAWCGAVDVAEMLIAAGANVKAVDTTGATPCHLAAAHGHSKIVRLLLAAGADLNTVDRHGRTPYHNAVMNGHDEIVGMLAVAGAVAAKKVHPTPFCDAANSDFEVDQKASALDSNDRIRRFAVCGVASSFDATLAALADARAARGRLDSLNVIAAMVTDSVIAEDSFGTTDTAAICALAAEFAMAEREFTGLQDCLRTADKLDPQVVATRDAARQQLVCVATELLERNDPIGTLTALGNRLASAKAALNAFQEHNGGDDDGGDCVNEKESDSVEFVDWHSAAHRLVECMSALTERAADALAMTVQSLCAGKNDSTGRDVAVALVGARDAAITEKRAAGALRIPGAAYAHLVAELDTVRARIANALRDVDRARHVRTVTAPNVLRLEEAQFSAAKIEKGIKYARADLEHPEDADSEEAAQARLSQLKAALVDAQRESTAALVELAAHVFDFPELRLRFPKARFDDFFAADGDASALRTLSLYEGRVVIAETRHTVERASIGGKVCVLKLFRLVPASQRAFVKEARRLRQLSHPNVVEVRAVFVDGAIGVIEMPLYVHGDLWQWIAAKARTVHDKLCVLRATLVGLEHVHRMGVVHADVKPENVFVDNDGVAKLGDFDVSKDDATRVTTASTVVGISLAYIAPEIVRGIVANKASDMYAVGLTLFDVVLGEKPIKMRPVEVQLIACHEPIENGTSLCDLTRRLVDEVADKRVNASGALNSPLFAPPAPGRDPQLHRRHCTVCSESNWLDEGIECDQRHFVCDACLEATVRAFCSVPPSKIAKRGGALRCQADGCATAWSSASLARSLSTAQFSAYLELSRKLSEDRALIEERQRHAVELKRLERRVRGEMAHDEEVAVHRREILDELLCMRCPRCKAAFIVDDFSRCLAMTCQTCNAAFCAWCLKDCGEDAHRHVNNCEHNPTQPRNVFSNAAQFEKAHRKRFGIVVSDYVRGLRNDKIRASVLASIQPELDDRAIELNLLN